MCRLAWLGAPTCRLKRRVDVWTCGPGARQCMAGKHCNARAATATLYAARVAVKRARVAAYGGAT